MNPTESKPETDRLLADFPPVSYGDWHRLVEAELKGAPFDKRMFTPTYEGITLKPIYRREDTAEPAAPEFISRLRPVCARDQGQRLCRPALGHFAGNQLLQPVGIQPRRAQFT